MWAVACSFMTNQTHQAGAHTHNRRASLHRPRFPVLGKVLPVRNPPTDFPSQGGKQVPGFLSLEPRVFKNIKSPRKANHVGGRSSWHTHIQWHAAQSRTGWLPCPKPPHQCGKGMLLECWWHATASPSSGSLKQCSSFSSPILLSFLCKGRSPLRSPHHTHNHSVQKSFTFLLDRGLQ